MAPLETKDVGLSTNIRWQEAEIPRGEKERMLGQRGCVLWLTGLSASGKSTVAMRVEAELFARGHMTMLLDGDNIRHGLNSNLGFSAGDRAENIRRVGEVAKLAAEAGVICLTSFISPYQKDRDAVRARLAPGDYVEIFCHAPLDLCERRDPKGLYKKAREGLIKNFTGIDDPYEEPTDPEIVLEPFGEDGHMQTPLELSQIVIRKLEEMGVVPRTSPSTSSSGIQGP